MAFKKAGCNWVLMRCWVYALVAGFSSVFFGSKTLPWAIATHTREKLVQLFVVLMDNWRCLGMILVFMFFLTKLIFRLNLNACRQKVISTLIKIIFMDFLVLKNIFKDFLVRWSCLRLYAHFSSYQSWVKWTIMLLEKCSTMPGVVLNFSLFFLFDWVRVRLNFETIFLFRI